MSTLQPDAEARSVWTTGQLAVRLGVSARTIERWCDDGTIAGATRSPGGHRRIPAASVEALLRGRRVVATARASITPES